MLDEEIKFYKANKQEFTSLYAGKFLAIKGRVLLGVYNTRTQAYEETTKAHTSGSFIIERPMKLL